MTEKNEDKIPLINEMNKVSELLDKIFNSPARKVWTEVRLVWEFLCRLWFWVPVLWRDRDWDFCFLVYMMRFKMLRMAKCIEANGFIEGDKRIGKQLRYAAWLSEVMMDGNKHPKVQALYDKLEANWGTYCKRDLTPEQEVITDEVGWLFMREKVTTREEYDQMRKDFGAWADANHKAEEDAKKRFFRHMERYIYRWWD